MIANRTGVFFESLDPREMADALASAIDQAWDVDALVAHADSFSAPRFRARLVDMIGLCTGNY